MQERCPWAEDHNYQMPGKFLFLVCLICLFIGSLNCLNNTSQVNQSEMTAQQADSLHLSILNLCDSLRLERYEQMAAKKHVRIREKSQWCEYNIYLPKGFNRSKSYYLVIGLHGYMDTADRFGLIWSDLKNRDIIFIVPESPFSVLESTEAVLKWGPFKNYKDVYSDDVYKKGEVAVIGILKNARQLFKIRQTWMLGFSQGAGFTYLIAFHYPELFDGITTLSGWFVQTGFTQAEYNNCKHIKVLISHGSIDPVVVYKQGLDARDALLQAGLTVRFMPFKGTHIVNRKAVKAMVKWIKE